LIEPGTSMGARQWIFTLPFPVSVNRYWRTFRGRVIVSAIGRQYQKDVASAVAGIMPAKPIEGRIAVEILLHAADARRRDIDNSAKALLDAMTKAGIWQDDSQIDDMRITRGFIHRDDPCAIVIVKMIV